MNMQLRIIVALLMLLGSQGNLFAQTPPKDLGDQVREVLVTKCSECHGGHLKRPKGAFGFVGDLKRLKKEYSNDPKLAESDLWYYLSEADEDEHMPPEKSKNGPLSTAELSLIRWWITAGGPLPQSPPVKKPAGIESSPPKEEVSKDDSPEKSEPSSNIVAALHPVLVHFPIAFIILSVLLEALRCRRGQAWRPALQLTLSLVLLSAILAGIAGFQAEDAEGYSEETVEIHQWCAIGGTILAGVAWFVLRRSSDADKVQTIIFRVLIIASAILISYAGHEGGLIVYGIDHFS